MRSLVIILSWISASGLADVLEPFELSPGIVGMSEQAFLQQSKTFRCQNIATEIRLTSCLTSKEIKLLGQDWNTASVTFASQALVGLKLSLTKTDSSRGESIFRQIAHALTALWGPLAKSVSNGGDPGSSEILWQSQDQSLIRLSLRNTDALNSKEIRLELISPRIAQTPLVLRKPAQ
jgi:hypothetical protein